MGKIIHHMKNSMVLKMLLSYATVILLSISLLGVVIYHNYIRILETKTSEYALSTIKLISEKMDAHIYKLEQVSLIMYQENLQEILTGPRGEGELSEMKREIRFREIFDMHLAFLNFGGEIKDVSFIFNDGNVLHKGSGVIDRDYDLAGSEWYISAVEAKGSGMVFGPHNQPYMIKIGLQSGLHPADIMESNYLSYVRSINTVDTSATIGVLMIDFGLSEIENIISPLKLGEKSEVYIVDDEGLIVYEINKKLIGQKLDSQITGRISLNDYGNYTTSLNNENVLVTYYSSDNTGWTFVNINPVRLIVSEISTIQRLFYFVVVICFGLTAMLSVMFSLTITRPVRKLKDTMKKVSEGELGIEADIKSRDEIGQLAQSFNYMVSRIRHLINEVYRTQIKEKEAQLNALQSQINPHFLYNTLESINAIAQVNEIKEISTISRSLASMFRYSIRHGYHLVELQEELNHVNNYVNIQKIRFGKKIRFHFNVSEETLRLKTIKLIIQPIIENAIIHGLELKRGGGDVYVSVYRDKEQVKIIVEDNGLGISADKLAAISAGLADNAPEDIDSHEHVGIINVHNRIRFYFGNKYGLHVESSVNEWTRVTIAIPATE